MERSHFVAWLIFSGVMTLTTIVLLTLVEVTR